MGDGRVLSERAYDRQCGDPVTLVKSDTDVRRIVRDGYVSWLVLFVLVSCSALVVHSIVSCETCRILTVASHRTHHVRCLIRSAVSTCCPLLIISSLPYCHVPSFASPDFLFHLCHLHLRRPSQPRPVVRRLL